MRAHTVRKRAKRTPKNTGRSKPERFCGSLPVPNWGRLFAFCCVYRSL